MKRFTLADLPANAQAEALRQLHPHIGHAAFYPSPTSPVKGVSDALPEHDAKLPSLGQNQDEGGSPGRIVLRIERRGTKLLDKDNLYGGVKYLCDAIRYENLIPADDPEAIELIVTQKKVKRGETETVVEISYP